MVVRKWAWNYFEKERRRFTYCWMIYWNFKETNLVISEHVCIDKIRELVKQCNNIIYRTIKMKSVYVEPVT